MYNVYFLLRFFSISWRTYWENLCTWNCHFLLQSKQFDMCLTSPMIYWNWLSISSGRTGSLLNGRSPFHANHWPWVLESWSWWESISWSWITFTSFFGPHHSFCHFSCPKELRPQNFYRNKCLSYGS